MCSGFEAGSYLRLTFVSLNSRLESYKEERREVATKGPSWEYPRGRVLKQGSFLEQFVNLWPRFPVNFGESVLKYRHEGPCVDSEPYTLNP
jgi:hypothetical protein